MPTFNYRKQAIEALTDADYRGESKPPNRADRVGKIYSNATWEKYVSALTAAAEYARKECDGRRLKQLTPEQAQAYLDRRAGEVTDKELNQVKLALEMLPEIDRGSLVKARALPPGEKATEPRAYTPLQQELVRDELPDRFQYSAYLCDTYGFRVREILTLRRFDELDRKQYDDGRILEKLERHDWDPDRFHGREGVEYVVVGKGGGPRTALISERDDKHLDDLKHDQPQIVKDRHDTIRQYYDLPGGLALSRAYSRASTRALGWSLGSHAARHAYVMDRMEYHLERGLTYDQAEELVAEEVGHFNERSTRAYLRVA